MLDLPGGVLPRRLARTRAPPEHVLAVPPQALVDVPAGARHVGVDLGHEGHDHAALGAELLQIGLGAHGAVGGSQRRRMGERELDRAAPELGVHGDDRHAHLLHALHEGLEERAQLRHADHAVGVPRARDRRERRGRRRRGGVVRVVDGDLVLDREARLEAHGLGLGDRAPQHRARAFRRHGAVRVVDVDQDRRRVLPPGQAAGRGGIRRAENVGEAVLVGGERRFVDVVRRGQPVDDVGPADPVGEPLVEREQLAAQPAVELRHLDLNVAHAVRPHALAHGIQPLVLRPAHRAAPAPAAAGFS